MWHLQDRLPETIETKKWFYKLGCSLSIAYHICLKTTQES